MTMITVIGTPGLARPRAAAVICSRNRRRAPVSDRPTRSMPTTPVSRPAGRSPRTHTVISLRCCPFGSSLHAACHSAPAYTDEA